MADRARQALPDTVAHGAAVLLGALTLVCSALHAYLVWHEGVSGLATTVPMLALAAMCTLCAPRLLRGDGEPKALVMCGGAAGAMVLVHLVGDHASSHHHGGGLFMHIGVLAAVAQVVVVALCWALSWRPDPPNTPHSAHRATTSQGGQQQ